MAKSNKMVFGQKPDCKFDVIDFRKFFSIAVANSSSLSISKMELLEV